MPARPPSFLPPSQPSSPSRFDVVAIIGLEGEKEGEATLKHDSAEAVCSIYRAATHHLLPSPSSIGVMIVSLLNTLFYDSQRD